jgi:ABC-2 type transport system permease protein
VLKTGANTRLAVPRLREQVRVLGHRSLRRKLRQPALVILPLFLPVLLFALYSSGLSAAGSLPHFPAPDYRDFAFAVPFLQGALFISVSAGTEMACDLESGVLTRLSLTPTRGSALILGQLAGAVLVGVLQTLAYLAVGLVFGVGLRSGAIGVLVLIALTFLIACGFAGLGSLIALCLGTSDAVQALYPLLLAAVFLSTANLPLHLIQAHWFRTIAACNPVSYLLEGIRSLVIVGFAGHALALGFGTAAGITIVSMTAASLWLRLRLASL